MAQFLTIFFIFSSIILQMISCKCPKFCECSFGKKEVSCTNVTDGTLKEIAGNILNDTERLTIRGNISKFGSHFHLRSLKVLDLDKNKLSMVPKNLSLMFPRLVQLKMTNNEIESIQPGNFEGLKTLHNLEVSSNLLTSIDDGTFQSLVNLQQLNLDSNRIKTISKDAFKGLGRLRKLTVNNNRLEGLKPGVFDYFKNGRFKLELNNNSISFLPNGLFTKLHTFEELMLSHNKIEAIGDQAFNNTQIVMIGLGNNQLKKVPASSFKVSSSTRHISLINNPIDCYCQNSKDLEFLKSAMARDGKCNAPTDLKGKPLQDFNRKTGLEIQEILCNACEINNTCSVQSSVCVPINKTELTCRCSFGYAGESCETFLQCSTSPCKNNGVCSENKENSYTCECRSGYGGKRCHIESTKIIIIVVVTVAALISLVLILIYLKRRKSSSQNTTKHESEPLK